MYFQGPIYQHKVAILYYGKHQYENTYTLITSNPKSNTYQNCYIIKKNNCLQELIYVNEYIDSKLNQNQNVQLLFKQDEEQYFLFLLFGFLIQKQISLAMLIELYGYARYIENISQYSHLLEEYENMISKEHKAESNENIFESTIFKTTSALLATSEFSEQPLFSQIMIEKQQYSQIFDQNHQFESVIISQRNKQIDILDNEEEPQIQNPNITPEKKRTN